MRWVEPSPSWTFSSGSMVGVGTEQEWVNAGRRQEGTEGLKESQEARATREDKGRLITPARVVVTGEAQTVHATPLARRLAQAGSGSSAGSGRSLEPIHQVADAQVEAARLKHLVEVMEPEDQRHMWQWASKRYGKKQSCC